MGDLTSFLFLPGSKDVRLPVQLQRAMAAEAEAAREARAKVIAAEGEQKASRALKEAAEVIQESPSALQVKKRPLIYFIFDRERGESKFYFLKKYLCRVP